MSGACGGHSRPAQAFMAMSPKQLSHPLFESANRTPLTLPVFGQVRVSF
jgi:hypothetical protein